LDDVSFSLSFFGLCSDPFSTFIFSLFLAICCRIQTGYIDFSFSVVPLFSL
jgi:hypothetical protein